jgi:undecaprenyl-diphosphatase
VEDIIRAIVLGVIQGLTEFLPISSSGHLILAREFFGWEFTDDLTFDVAAHVGTTAAVVAFFWREWRDMVRRSIGSIITRSRSPVGIIYDERLLLLIIAGSIPAAIVGVVFNFWLQDHLRGPRLTGVMLLLFGLVLYAADRWAGGSRGVSSIRIGDAAFIGVAQAVSLIPGVSRSGVTISAGMALGFSRYEAARFSFLLSTPAILGAGALKSAEAVYEGVPVDDLVVIGVGALVSAAAGWLAIRYLLAVLQRGTLVQFVIYRLVVGAFVIAYFS